MTINNLVVNNKLPIHILFPVVKFYYRDSSNYCTCKTPDQTSKRIRASDKNTISIKIHFCFYKFTNNRRITFINKEISYDTIFVTVTCIYFI